MKKKEIGLNIWSKKSKFKENHTGIQTFLLN